MTTCFKENTEAVELVLRIVLEKPDIKVEDVRTQHDLKNIRGGSVRLDIYAVDSDDKRYNIEIQRADNGAGARRARYNISLDNGGILGNASCDYDGRTITAGTELTTTVFFSFPGSLSNELSTMNLSVADKTINLCAKPQKNEEYDTLEGTYEQSGMKMVFVKISDSSYQLFDYNSVSGLDISNITVNDNNIFSIGKAMYIYLPTEHAIYYYTDGEVDKDGAAHFIKKNKLVFDTVPLEEVEKASCIL